MVDDTIAEHLRVRMTKRGLSTQVGDWCTMGRKSYTANRGI